MCNRKKQAGPNFYDWIVSQEIRDYLRKNHRFSFAEKVRLIVGGCRPLEEKYDALRALWEESEGEEKTLAAELVRLHDWAFDQLHRETLGKVFIFMEELGCDAGGQDTRYHGVDRMFCTYEELVEYIKEYESWCHGEPFSGVEAVGKAAFIEKWVPVEGEMKAIIAFSLFHIEGQLCFQRFFPWWLTHGKESDAHAEQLGISEDAVFLYENNSMNHLPLPFQTGDLVRLETPDWDGPLYGVLGVFEALGRYMNMAYIKDGCLELISLSYWWIDVVSDWQTIDWLRHAEPSELPTGQEVLVEMGAYLRRLERQNVYAAESAFYDIVGRYRNGQRETHGREVYRTAEPIPFQELLEEVRKEEL